MHEHPSPFQETKRHLESMWTFTPQIEGLTPDESASVYANNYDPLLEKLRTMKNAAERDRLILKMYSAACAAIHQLSDAGTLHLEDFILPEKARRYFANCEAVSGYADALLKLYEQKD